MGFLSKISAKLDEWFTETPPEDIYRTTMKTRGNGVIIGMYKEGITLGKPIGADGHFLVVGGPGSGKSSCIALPTLKYGWKSPALVVDIKGELYSKSFRIPAYVFNPMNSTAPGYDPFVPLYRSHHPASDVEDMAKMLIPAPTVVKDPFWHESAQNILAAHLLYSFKRGATFLQAIRTLLNTEPALTLEIETEEDAECRLFLMQVSRSEKTLSSVMQTLNNAVRPLVSDEYLAATLAKREVITPQLLEQGSSIFLQLPQAKLEQWRPLISLIIQQFCRHFEQRPEGIGRPILFLLDEFPRLGNMPQVVHGLATLRSKNITIMLIVQSLAQLDVTYGHDQRKVIADNCDYKAILKATDADTQKYFSDLVGTYEKQKVTYTTSSQLGASSSSSTSTTTEDKLRIKPEEFAYLQDIVLLAPYGYCRLQKMPYWSIG